jgi:nucleoside-diphosphate-sugar epimerase
MTEVLAGAYASSYGLEAVGLRYFTVYGPRQRPDMGLSRFIEAAVAEREIPIYGDGRQRRDMTYVGDVIAATLAAAERGRAGAVYNIASGVQRALLDIIDELGRVLDVPLRVIHEDAKPGDVRDTWGDITCASRELSYTPDCRPAGGPRATGHRGHPAPRPGHLHATDLTGCSDGGTAKKGVSCCWPTSRATRHFSPAPSSSTPTASSMS